MICSAGNQKKVAHPRVAVLWAETNSSTPSKQSAYLVVTPECVDDGADKTAEVQEVVQCHSKMKKFINILTIVFFLSPAFAMADSFSWDTSSGSVGSNPTFTTSISPGNACAIFDLSGNRQNTYEGSNCGSTFTDLAAYVLDWGLTLADWNGSAGTIHAGVISPYNGTSAPLCDTYANCVASGYYSNDDTFTFGASPPPPPAPDTTIDAAIGVATSSFALTFGFDMDQVSTWMWTNLGQPILGSGIGTLYVMRWFWLGFIAISIIVLFGFAYFRFFKR